MSTRNDSIRFPANHSCSMTQNEVANLSHVLTITNFSFLQNVGCIESEAFGDGRTDEQKWQLKVYPKGMDANSGSHISVMLFLISQGSFPVAAKFQISILNAYGERVHMKKENDAPMFEPGKGLGFGKFIRQDTLLKDSRDFLHLDRLTLLCEISFVSPTINAGNPQVGPTGIRMPTFVARPMGQQPSGPIFAQNRGVVPVVLRGDHPANAQHLGVRLKELTELYQRSDPRRYFTEHLSQSKTDMSYQQPDAELFEATAKLARTGIPRESAAPRLPVENVELMKLLEDAERCVKAARTAPREVPGARGERCKVSRLNRTDRTQAPTTSLDDASSVNDETLRENTVTENGESSGGNSSFVNVSPGRRKFAEVSPRSAAVKPTIFRGDPDQFTAWFENFHDTVISRQDLSIGEKFKCLKNSLAGEAVDVISNSGCDSTAYFATIKKLLEKYATAPN